MKNRKLDRRHVGFRLLVSHDGGRRFSQKAGLFGSRYSAETFNDLHGKLPCRIEGVRRDYTRLEVKDNWFSDRKSTKRAA